MSFQERAKALLMLKVALGDQVYEEQRQGLLID
jgi:hypothetical protein